MARKPNYSFERNKRAKAKAAKREAKRAAKVAAREKKAGVTSAGTTDDAAAEPEGSPVGPDPRIAGVIPPEGS